jgi:hypothetical protein
MITARFDRRKGHETYIIHMLHTLRRLSTRLAEQPHSRWPGEAAPSLSANHDKVRMDFTPTLSGQPCNILEAETTNNLALELRALCRSAGIIQRGASSWHEVAMAEALTDMSVGSSTAALECRRASAHCLAAIQIMSATLQCGSPSVLAGNIRCP